MEAAAAPGGRPTQQALAARLGVGAEALPAVLRALGVRLAPGAALPEGQAGPPSPPMMLPRRRAERIAPQAPRPEAPAPEGPFAALRALRREAAG